MAKVSNKIKAAMKLWDEKLTRQHVALEAKGVSNAEFYRSCWEMYIKEIDPWDLAIGKVVVNHKGIMWFKSPGIVHDGEDLVNTNLQDNGEPVWEKLHRDDGGPAMIANESVLWRADCSFFWVVNGKMLHDYEILRT